VERSKGKGRVASFYSNYRAEIHTALSIVVALALASDVRHALGKALGGQYIAYAALILILILNMVLAYLSWRTSRHVQQMTLAPFRDSNGLHDRALSRAYSKYYLLGMSAEELQHTANSDYFQRRNKQGKRIRDMRILLLHPDSPSFFWRIQEVNPAANTQYLVDRKKDIMRALRMNLKSLVPDIIDRAQIRLYTDFPIWLIQAYDTDSSQQISELEVSMHPPGMHGRYSPRYKLSKSAPVFSAYEREFTKRWIQGLPMNGDDFPPLYGVPPVRAVIFDLDGTLIDSDGQKRETVWEILSALRPISRIEFDAEYSNLEGMPRSAILSELRDRFLAGSAHKTTVDMMVDRYEVLYSQKLRQIEEMPGTTAILQALSQRYTVHIASSAPGEEVETAVKVHGWEKYVSSAYGFPTPKSDAIMIIAEECAISTREIVYVGDRLIDEKSALAVGANCVRIGEPIYSQSIKCAAVAEVPSIIDQLGRG